MWHCFSGHVSFTLPGNFCMRMAAVSAQQPGIGNCTGRADNTQGPLIAAILMQKFPGSVKLTSPENQCHIMRRLENWKRKDLPATGYIYITCITTFVHVRLEFKHLRWSRPEVLEKRPEQWPTQHWPMAHRILNNSLCVMRQSWNSHETVIRQSWESILL